MSDVILNKMAIIERCVKRVHEEYDDHQNEFSDNYTRQDSVVLNIQRACEAAIDMGMHVVRIKQLGSPQSSREIFNLLADEKIITQEQAVQLQKMVGFRNIAVHNYTKLDLNVVEMIIKKHLQNLVEFGKQIILQKNN